jgi:hypothetical protein
VLPGMGSVVERLQAEIQRFPGGLPPVDQEGGRGEPGTVAVQVPRVLDCGEDPVQKLGGGFRPVKQRECTAQALLHAGAVQKL